MINTPSRYWRIWRVSPAEDRLGYKQIPVPIALEFAKNQVSNVENQDNSHTQNLLLSYFHAKKTHLNAIERAQAGLCLRCYVSEPILRECKKIDSLFSGGKQFTYRDLLPFVLNDDGQKLIILDRDGKTQLMVDDSQTKVSRYKFFSVTVLQTFNTDLQSRMSLDNWAYLQTKQNPELKNFLSEFGFQHLSDWALINRVRVKQLERLSSQERYIVEAFHAVYRRDRQMQHNKGAKKCPDPTNAQLQEMLAYLQQYQVSIDTPVQLLKELKNIAVQIRRYDIWSSRESLDIYDAESGTYQPRRDLPADSFDEVDVEQQEFLQFLQKNLYAVLSDVIQQQVEANIKKLQKSSKYAPFADKYMQGLRLYYNQAMSLKEIMPHLGMTSWDQTRRILNPGDLLASVRTQTVAQMLESILKKAGEKGLTEIPPSVNYLKTLTEQIESYVDVQVFQAAAEEIRAGKNRTMDSIYAQKLRACIS
ncbi:hypothetical protein NIES4071_09090 [Calothrix sp. NIES-4071]|nr:hypothetical protein NIES4071_09090 [Calothrix sp. NIES-4071]BAZ55251.1 hypothetical protein NIES4105_09050 [Calothrix sp. NIES-4105]